MSNHTHAQGHMVVTFQAIGDAAADCDNINGQFQRELEDLRKYLAPMVETWQGQAAVDYQALQARWDSSARDLSEILTEVAKGLRIAQQNYEETERANSSIWAG